MVYLFNPDINEYAKVHSFSVWDHISHCNIAKENENHLNEDRKFPFRIGAGYVGFNNKAFRISRCMNENNKWDSETNSVFNCFLFPSFVTLMPVLDLNDEEIIVIICKTPFKEYIKELFIEGKMFS